jgi:hypothetical protein
MHDHIFDDALQNILKQGAIRMMEKLMGPMMSKMKPEEKERRKALEPADRLDDPVDLFRLNFGHRLPDAQQVGDDDAAVGFQAYLAELFHNAGRRAAVDDKYHIGRPGHRLDIFEGLPRLRPYDAPGLVMQ